MTIKWNLLEHDFTKEFLCTKYSDLNSHLWNNFLIYFPKTVMLHQLGYEFRYETEKNGEGQEKKACIFFLFCITDVHFVFIVNIFLSFS